MKIILCITSIVLLCCLCINANDVFRFDMSQNSLNDISDGLCPNNKTKCTSSGTCCKTKHHSYHCCRYQDAVCCPDLYHCCPSGTTCVTETKKCQKNADKVAPSSNVDDVVEWKVEKDSNGDSLEMKELTKSEPLLTQLNSNNNNNNNNRLEDEPFCPNNKSRCKATKTCCITNHGNYYCCPHKNAVCCSDKWLCCPEGATCDIKNKKCINSNTITKMDSINKPSELKPTNSLMSAVEMFLSAFIKLGRHCGNSQKSCPGEKKCCQMAGDNFGCCKYRKGVCCPDFATCCPHDTTCDVKNKACTAIPASLVPASLEVASVCPDNRTTCKDTDTCCSVGNVLYGCCPMKDATCCSDKASCCPHNKRCDLNKRRCVPKDEKIVTEPVKIKTIGTEKRRSLMMFLSKIGAAKTCPDGTDTCTDQQTCCILKNNSYGCCPYKQGTCCPDKLTCCPNNAQCSQNSCI